MIIYFPMKIHIYEKNIYFRSIIFKKINYSDNISVISLKKESKRVKVQTRKLYLKKIATTVNKKHSLWGGKKMTVMNLNVTKKIKTSKI